MDELARGKPDSAKLSSALFQLAQAHERGALARAAHAQAARVEGDRVLVTIQAERGHAQAASAAATARSGRISATYHEWIDAYVPAGELLALAEHPSVHRLDLPTPLIRDVTSEGASLVNAPPWHSAGLTGAGVKIGIIDGGFQGYTSLLGVELPASVDTSCTVDPLQNEENHGTAVAEIVHDVAPAAQLFFASVSTLTEAGTAMECLVSKGVNIINVSAGSPYSAVQGPGDGSGLANDIVSRAVNAGIFWVNSAGNSAQKHWSGPWTDADSDDWLDFASGDGRQEMIAFADDLIFLGLRWSDSWPGACADYDLYLYNSSESIVSRSTDRQDCSSSSRPVETLAYTVSTFDIYYTAIRRSGPSGVHRFDLISANHNLEHRTASNSLLHPADSASPGMAAVGAVDWLSPTVLERFSSQGPTTDGRIKPDLVAPDNVTTFTLGFANFSGTSASAPHVAGAAALVKQANPGFTPAQIKSFLQLRAVDLGAAGADNQFGSGRVHLGNVPTIGPTPTVGPAIDNARAVTGPFSFTLSPGGQVDFDVTFENSGTTTWRAADGYVMKNLELGTRFELGACDGFGPGRQCRWSVRQTVGLAAGELTRRFRMHHSDTPFGDTITAAFVVSSPSPSATRTPTVTPASPTPTATPTSPPGPGGRGFTLTMVVGRIVLLSWQPGSQQASYALDRFTASGLQQLPVPGGAGATSASDELPSADTFACYRVQARSATGGVLFNSDFFCAIPGFLQGSGPSGLSVRLDQSNAATVSWIPAPGATGYSVLELISGRTQRLGSNVTSTTDNTGGNVVCYLVQTDGGMSDVACAVPGFSGP